MSNGDRHNEGMRIVRRSPAPCDRAHQWVSLRLDGELSQLEGALLDAHLARCSACAAYAADVDGLTRDLRSALLESLEQPIAVPRRRRIPLRLANVSAAAALLAVAAGVGSIMSGSEGHVRNPSLARVQAADGVNDERQLRDVRRAQLRAEVAMLQTNSSRTVFGHST
jgi:anti-sigma factor RsiW